MSLNQTPCIEVDTNNVSQIWPHLISFLNQSQFIACDFVSHFNYLIYSKCNPLFSNM